MRERRAGSWLLVVSLAVANMGAAGDLRLVEAVQGKDWKTAAALVSQKVDVNASRADGETALHWAAHWDHLETADLLLRVGARVNAANAYGVTPLWLACENGSGAMVERLLKAGANPSATLPSGESPLMTCARAGSLPAVKALLAMGADAKAQERVKGQTALMWAVSQRHPDVVKALLEHGADVQARTHVTQRLVQSNRYATEQSRGSGFFVAEQGGFTPLLFAAQQGDAESAGLLLAAGANVNDASPDGVSALVTAAHSDHRALAALLLDRGADPNAAGAGYTALHAAVLRGDLEMVKTLLQHGANPNAPLVKGTPVRAYSQDFALAASLVGATPLWLAARFAEPDLMRTLVAGGADPRFTMKDGTTVLMAAMNTGSGNGDRRDRLLSPAAQAVKTETDAASSVAPVRTAIELGADVNAVNGQGNSALHLATTKGFNAVIEVLVAGGARLDLKNSRGLTPLALVAGRPADEGEKDFRGGPRAASNESTAALLRTLGAKE